MVYEVNGQVGVRMGRRRKYLINAYTKSLHLNTDCFTCPIVFFHFFLYFLLRSGTVYFFSLSHAYSKKYLSAACIYKESIVGICVLVCSLPVCHTAQALFECVTNGFHRALLVLFSSCTFGTLVYFSCHLD